MDKSTFSTLYDTFRAKLVDLRRGAGLTQRALAERLRRERSFVARIEQGERRVDLVEFYWICRACGADPAAVFLDLATRLSAARRAPGSGGATGERAGSGWGAVADGAAQRRPAYGHDPPRGGRGAGRGRAGHREGE